MRDNDELIAFTELGSEIDLRFYGVAFVLRPDGSTARELGNPKRAVNLRSILKLVRGSLLCERLSIKASDVLPEHAVLVGSHDGLEIHRDAVAGLARLLQVDASDARCPLGPPQNPLEALRLSLDGSGPDLLRHQCLGEHLGVLRMCRDFGGSYDYASLNHEVHTAVFDLVNSLGMVASVPVLDRCGMPTLVLPAIGIARTLSRLLAGDRSGFMTIQNAIAAYPQHYAGPGRFSTKLSEYSGGRVLAKESASGGFIAWNRNLGDVILAFCSSGEHAASESAMIALMRAEGWIGSDFGESTCGGQLVRSVLRR